MSETNAQSVVILGTSPVLLMEGLFRARAGQQVVFVEANADIGGAWALTQAMGLSDVEAACHLIVNYRNVYKFMVDDCGIPMEVVAPQPLLFRSRRLTAFNARRHVFRRCSGLLLRSGLVAVVRLVETMLVVCQRLFFRLGATAGLSSSASLLRSTGG